MRCFIVFISLFLQMFGYSQLLTLEEYCDSVLNYSRQVHISRLTTTSSKNQEKNIKTGFFPKIDGKAQAYIDPFKVGKTSPSILGPIENYGYTASLQLNQIVYDGGVTWQKYKASSIETEIDKIGEEISQRDERYAAISAYWTVAANYEMYKINKQYISIVEKLQEIVNVRFEDGYISRMDLLMIENRVKEAEVQINSIEEQYLVSAQQLQIQMGHLPADNLPQLESIFSFLNNPVLSDADSLIERIPSYKKAGKTIELQRRYAKLDLASLNPQLSFTLTGGWGTQSPNIGGNTDFYSQAMINFSMPLFHWGERSFTANSDRAKILMMEYQKSLVRDQLIESLNTFYINIQKSAQRIQIAKESLTLANENLDLSTFSYNEGRIPILDVLSAQISWIQAYSNYVSANLTHKLAVAAFQRLLSE